MFKKIWQAIKNHETRIEQLEKELAYLIKQQQEFTNPPVMGGRKG